MMALADALAAIWFPSLRIMHAHSLCIFQYVLCCIHGVCESYKQQEAVVFWAEEATKCMNHCRTF